MTNNALSAALGFFRLSYSVAKLGADSAIVVTLRSGVMARGGRAAKRELTVMVAEKVEAFAEAQELLLSRGPRMPSLELGQALIDVYSRRVRRNRQRLG